jgi:hypothetical protein
LQLGVAFSEVKGGDCRRGLVLRGHGKPGQQLPLRLLGTQFLPASATWA